MASKFAFLSPFAALRRIHWTRRRVVLASLGGLAVLGLAGLAVVWALVRSQPAFYRQHMEFLRDTPPEKLARMAAQFEERLRQELGVSAFDALVQEARAAGASRPGARLASRLPGGMGDPGPAGAVWPGAAENQPGQELNLVRETFMSFQELNVWLSTRLDEWLEYRGQSRPTALRTPVLGRQADGLRLAFEYHSAGFSQVFDAGFALEIRDDGRALLQLTDIRLGRMPVPQGAMGTALRAGAPASDGLEQAAHWLDKLRNVEFSPVFPLTDHVKARILACRQEPEGIRFQLRLEPRGGVLHRPATPEPAIASVPTP